MRPKVLLALLSLIFLSTLNSVNADDETCDEDELPCDSGETSCIPRTSWCDDEQDCSDGSDENYCEKKSFFLSDPNKCKDSETHFLCKTGICVPKVAVCDEFDDCGDNSDEKDCDKKIKDDNEVDSDSGSDSDSDEKDKEDEKKPEPFFPDKDEEDNVVVSGVPARPGGHKDAVDRGAEWLLSVRQTNYGWGEDTSRALIALGLTKPHFFQSPSEDVDLMKKQLQVIVAVDMLKNRTQPVSLSRLSLYINALLATCQDPFNFHGMDLVKELRERVSASYVQAVAQRHRDPQRQRPEVFINPVAHLTLCIANSSIINDVHNMMNIIRVQRNELRWQDMKALGIMALSCIVQNYDFASGYRQALHQVVEHLQQSMSQSLQGSFGNKYSTALAVQALLSVNGLNWDARHSINYLKSFQEEDGSFGDLLSTYFILPTLSGQSLVRLKSMPCFETIRDPDGFTPLELLLDYQGPRHYVRYTLLYGLPVEVSYSILLHVPVGTKFFDIMRLAQHTDPKFKFQYEEKDSNIVVFSVGNVPNDAERGIYWQLYAKLNGRHSHTNEFQREIGSDLRLYTKGVANLVPNNRDHVAFWYRP